MGNSKSKNKGAAAAPSASASAASSSGSDVSGIRQPLSLGADAGTDADPAAAPLAGGSEFAPADKDSAAVVDTQEAALSFWEKGKTFRPQRAVPEAAAKGNAGRILHTVQATMKATLGGGDLEKAVKCPPGEDKNEWIAVNTVQFFNAASLIYGTVVLYCTEKSCPTMSAGKAEYLWKDEGQYQKPTRVPAPTYIDLMMNEIDAQITDEKIFPVEENVKFPRNYMTIVRQIFKRLFRLYAHIYNSHSDRIRSIGASAHLNTTFRHLYHFIKEFDLVPKQEMQPLQKLIDKLEANMNDGAAGSGEQ